MDDAEAWERAAEGDGDAFGVVFDLHKSRVQRHLSRLLASPQDVEDAVAIVFREAWRKRASVRVVHGSVVPWLLLTATYVANNQRRRARRYREVLDALPPVEPTYESDGLDEPDVMSATDPNAPAGQCADNHLAVSVQNDPTGSGAGQRLSYVVFRNTGSSTCVLRGAPGVSLVGGGNGTQIGAAATRSGGGPAVTIPAGSYALADLTYPNIDENGGAYGDGEGHDPQCEAKAADGYRIYPPHSFRAYFSTDKTYGCSTTLRTLRVGTVKPASKYPYFKPARGTTLAQPRGPLRTR